MTHHHDLMYVADAALYLNRTEGALRMMIARGSVPYRRVAGRLCLLRSEIDAWLDGSPGLRLEELNCRSARD